MLWARSVVRTHYATSTAAASDLGTRLGLSLSAATRNVLVFCYSSIFE